MFYLSIVYVILFHNLRFLLKTRKIDKLLIKKIYVLFEENISIIQKEYTYYSKENIRIFSVAILYFLLYTPKEKKI